MIEIIESMMPLFIVLIVIAMMVKFIKKMLSNRKKKKKVDKPMSEDDRIYIGLKKGAKASNLLKHVDVFVTGDESSKGGKIGETATGVLPMNDEIVFFIRSKWWKFWEESICVRVEPELMGDMNMGQIVIKGKGLRPDDDRYACIIPPIQFYEDIDPNTIEDRRMEVMSMRFKRLLANDLNQDRSYAVKHGMRGDRELAHRELYTPRTPLREKQVKLRKEQERKRQELQNKGNKSQSNQLQELQQMQGGI